jgi:hypothetical protein
MVMAVRLSVTESIAALTIGILIEPAAEPRANVCVLRENLAVCRHQQDVVEGQALAKGVVEHAAI